MKEELKRLEEEWSHFRDFERDKKDALKRYQALMVKTWPFFVEGWIKQGDLVDKDLARLLCTMGGVFDVLFDECGNFLGNEELEDSASTHYLFIDCLFYYDDYEIKEGKIYFDEFVVDPLLFEFEWID